MRVDPAPDVAVDLSGARSREEAARAAPAVRPPADRGDAEAAASAVAREAFSLATAAVRRRNKRRHPADVAANLYAWSVLATGSEVLAGTYGSAGG
jgi:hypothetical protein